MSLVLPTQTLKVSFRVKHGNGMEQFTLSMMQAAPLSMEQGLAPLPLLARL